LALPRKPSRDDDREGEGNLQASATRVVGSAFSD
jgi:hypothetical protein